MIGYWHHPVPVVSLALVRSPYVCLTLSDLFGCNAVHCGGSSSQKLGVQCSKLPKPLSGLPSLLGRPVSRK